MVYIYFVIFVYLSFYELYSHTYVFYTFKHFFKSDLGTSLCIKDKFWYITTNVNLVPSPFTTQCFCQEQVHCFTLFTISLLPPAKRRRIMLMLEKPSLLHSGTSDATRGHACSSSCHHLCLHDGAASVKGGHGCSSSQCNLYWRVESDVVTQSMLRIVKIWLVVSPALASSMPCMNSSWQTRPHSTPPEFCFLYSTYNSLFPLLWFATYFLLIYGKFLINRTNWEEVPDSLSGNSVYKMVRMAPYKPIEGQCIW